MMVRQNLWLAENNGFLKLSLEIFTMLSLYLSIYLPMCVNVKANKQNIWNTAQRLEIFQTFTISIKNKGKVMHCLHFFSCLDSAIVKYTVHPGEKEIHLALQTTCKQ